MQNIIDLAVWVLAAGGTPETVGEAFRRKLTAEMQRNFQEICSYICMSNRKELREHQPSIHEELGSLGR